MNTYAKIETLFNRDERFRVIEGSFRRPEYEDIAMWNVSEKINGTNMRIGFTRVIRVHSTGPEPDEHVTDVKVRGKTDNASLATTVLEHCYLLAASGLVYMEKQLDVYNLTNITLHGEGYGARVNQGHAYRPDEGFILYDVETDGGKFLSDDAVTEYALALGLPRVPILGYLSTSDIVAMVHEGFDSHIGGYAEGVVARTRVPLYDNRGERVMWKLKTKDFRGKQLKHNPHAVTDSLASQPQ